MLCACLRVQACKRVGVSASHTRAFENFTSFAIASNEDLLDKTATECASTSLKKSV